jgi:hypothetical protein
MPGQRVDSECDGDHGHAGLDDDEHSAAIEDVGKSAGRKGQQSTGRLVAVWTKATSSGLPDSMVRNHWAPTVCAQVPTSETTWAIHSMRKTRWRNGAQAPGVVASV